MEYEEYRSLHTCYEWALEGTDEVLAPLKTPQQFFKNRRPSHRAIIRRFVRSRITRRTPGRRGYRIKRSAVAASDDDGPAPLTSVTHSHLIPCPEFAEVLHV